MMSVSRERLDAALDDIRYGIRKARSQKHPVSFLLTYAWKRMVGFFYVRAPFPFTLLELVYRPTIDRGTYRLRMSRSPMSTMFYRSPRMYREDEAFLKHYLKAGMVYVDVGANIGTTTLCAADIVGEHGTVLAFEPHPKTFNHLKENVELNPALAQRVSLHNIALGADEHMSYMSDMLANDENFIGSSGVPVFMTTLDKALAKVLHIDLLKIDVEGYEKNVFLGATKTLSKSAAIYFENCEANFSRFGYCAQDIFDILHAADFSIFLIKKDFQLEKIPTGYRRTKGYENLLALPHSSTT
jgi:FkbM family methyltransferase